MVTILIYDWHFSPKTALQNNLVSLSTVIHAITNQGELLFKKIKIINLFSTGLENFGVLKCMFFSLVDFIRALSPA